MFYNVSVYVPSTIDVDKPIDNTEYVQSVAREFSKHFGGATAQPPSKGFYLAENGELVEENITIVSSFSKLSKAQTKKIACGIAENLRNTLRQESVLVTLNQTPIFV